MLKVPDVEHYSDLISKGGCLTITAAYSIMKMCHAARCIYVADHIIYYRNRGDNMNTIIAEGECGRSGNARWQLDDTGRLTISGTGSTSVYSFSIPWEKYIDKITCVTYMEGITDISDDLSGMINVRRLELSSTVTSIFGRFENCSKLSEIIVTDDLTYISDLALEDTLWYKRQPKGMVYLGRIFYGCKGGSKDSTVKIKEGTLGIARGAFRYTNENIHIDIPSSVKCIAHSAHTFPDKCECMSIGEINWTLEPDGKLYFGGDRGIMKDLKNADEQPWKNIRHNIRCAVKSSGIECKNIGKNIFAQCSIEEIMLGDTVEVISAGAFKNCTSLRRVTGLGKVCLIEKGAFSGCTALTEFEVPKLMKGISGQELVRYNEDNDIVFKPMTETTATIKELIGGYGENFTWSIDDSGTMRLIGEGIMPYNEKYNCSDKSFDDNKIRKMVRRLIIDERITEIGFKAFSGFTEMTAADLPVGLKRIGSDAFSDCVSLSRLIIPDSTKTIGDGAFSRSGLESIVIPKSVTKLADFAFLNCKKLTQITLPESVMPGAFVFRGSGLEKYGDDDIFYLNDLALGFKSSYSPTGDRILRFKKGTKRIAPLAFGRMDYPIHEELVGVILDNDITYLGDEAFRCCHELATVTADCTFTRIDCRCFSCTKWAELQPIGQLVYLANAVMGTVTNVKSYSQGGLGDEFTGKVIEIDKTHGEREITVIADGAFSGEKTVRRAIIPETIKYIGDLAFSGCRSLKKTELHEGLERIGDKAFLDCNIKEIHIPHTVTEIGRYALGYRYAENKIKRWLKGSYVKLEGFVIRGEYGSAAHRYAIENEFEFKDI